MAGCIHLSTTRKDTILHSHLRGFGPHTLLRNTISFANMSDKPLLPTINTTNKFSVQVEPVHPPEPAQTYPPSDPPCLSPKPAGTTPSSVLPSPTFPDHSSVHQHDSRALRNNQRDPGPSGGESLLDPGAMGLVGNANIASYATTIPGAERSQLCLVSNSMASAASAPQNVCSFISLFYRA